MEFRVLQGVPPADVRTFLAMTRKRSFDWAEVVFHEGDTADAVHLVTRGRFALRVVSPLGRSAMLAVRGPGESFGEFALLAAERGAVALERGRIRVLDPEALATRVHGLQQRGGHEHAQARARAVRAVLRWSSGARPLELIGVGTRPTSS